MSTRPCPTCGANLPTDGRFCGQCGTTVAASVDPGAPPTPPAGGQGAMISEHDEVTVARDMPNLALIKTMMDAAPFGASAAGAHHHHHPGPGQHNPGAAIPTPVVPPPETHGAPIHPGQPLVPGQVLAQGGPPKAVAKTMLMSQTMADPEMGSRAREMIDDALGRASTAQAPPLTSGMASPAPAPAAAPAAAPAPKPKPNFVGTMMMGGEALMPPAGAAPAPVPPHVAAATGAPSEETTRKDASPLSRSVLAPQSWGPPPTGAPAPAAPAGAGGGAPPVDVNRVVSVGPPPDQQPQPQPQRPPQPQGGAAGAGALRTMLGMPASALGVPGAASHSPNLGGTVAMSDASAAREQVQQMQQQQQQQPRPHNVQKTMMGVAIPGIAPTNSGNAGAPAQPFQSAPGGPPSMGAGGGPIDLRSKQSTMLGVAIPGIAPTHNSPEAGPYSHGSGAQGFGAQGYQGQGVPSRGPAPNSKVQNTALGMMAVPDVKIVPRPRTLIDEPLPQMPELRPKKGVPAVALVAIVAALVLVGGGVITFLALRAGAPLSAVPQLDENGRESLKIGCTSCPDGTKVSLGASSATVTGGAAVLPLPAPLSIGENDLAVKIERPSGGRNEEVKVHVPVAYRVRADLATLSARPPAITVRIEATAGSEVKVDDKPVPLDATGRGAYAIDLSKETEGPGEPKTFERKIPFAITPKGGKLEVGELTARTAIVPLAIDAPGRELVTDKASAAVSGQTRAGTTIAIDGQNVAVDAQGRFGVRVELAAVGDKPLEIVAAAPPLAPRIAKVKVTRVASLEAAAKEQDAQSPIGYDVFGADPASKIGQKAIVEGEIVDARVTAGHTVLLLEDKRKCAKGASCLVRVVHGDEVRATRGDVIRAYGRVLGSVSASGKTVPDIEAALVLPIKVAK